MQGKRRQTGADAVTEVTRAAPFLSDPIVLEAEAGGAPVPAGSPEALNCRE